MRCNYAGKAITANEKEPRSKSAAAAPEGLNAAEATTSSAATSSGVRRIKKQQLRVQQGEEASGASSLLLPLGAGCAAAACILLIYRQFFVSKASSVIEGTSQAVIEVSPLLESLPCAMRLSLASARQLLHSAGADAEEAAAGCPGPAQRLQRSAAQPVGGGPLGPGALGCNQRAMHSDI